MKKILKFFDKLEDRIRAVLSVYTILYAFIGGVTIVIFWRGVWHTVDILMSKGGIWKIIFYEPITILWTTLLLLATGLFVSFFVGDRIILSGVKKEKRLDEKTVEDIKKEDEQIQLLRDKVDKISRNIEEIKQKLCSPAVDEIENK